MVRSAGPAMVALALCVGLLLPPLAGVAQPLDDVSIRPMTVDVVDGPADDQRVSIDATLYVPPTASPATPAPAVVMIHGFGGNKADLDGAARQSAAAGYVVMAYSARGFGASSGAIGLASKDYDAKDARQLVDRLAGVPEVLLDGPGDPRVGFTGYSYGGGISLMAATQDPRIDAVAARITWNDLGQALAPGGVLKVQWISIFFLVGLLGGPPAPGGCGGFMVEACDALSAAFVAGVPTAASDALLGASSPSRFLENLRVPTLLAQGEEDTLFDLNQSVRTYEGLRASGVAAKLLWHDGGHSAVVVEPAVVGGRILAWWDRWLRRQPATDTGPAFEYYLRNFGLNGVGYVSAPGYPVGQPVPLYLSGNGSLVSDRTQVTPASLVFANPVLGLPAAYSETAGLQSRVLTVPPLELPGQHLSWDSAPLGKGATAVGVPRLRVNVTSGTATVWFYAKLYDVAPDGGAELIHRQARPMRADVTSGSAVELDLAGVAHRFEPGHRVRLVLAATDASYLNRRVADTYLVTVDPDDPPQLTVPWLEPPAEAVPAR